MTDTITTYKDDYGYDLDFTIKDSDGVARDITNYTVTLKVWQPETPTTLDINAACSIDIAANGTCHYTVQDGDLDASKTYYYELELTDTGVKESSNTGLLIVKDSS